MASDVLRIPYEEVAKRLVGILRGCGVAEERAERCAQLFADASRDGVPSHGLNRVAWVVSGLREGKIVGNAEMKLLAQFGAVERWDGMLGLGQWNAWESMGRAIEIARENGMGCVGLSRTNHWMRAGSYGWQAAEAGCIGICWTNTIPLMPAWGVKGRRVGNNPLVMAVPRKNGEHMVLDMAMAQYSMGKLRIYQRAGKESPTAAGFDAEGKETRDPEAIIEGGSAMPIGFWKGSGLAIMLDVIAAVISGGLTTGEMTKLAWEHRVSQVYMAIDVRKVGVDAEEVAERVVGYLKEGGELASYPGERVAKARRESMELGVAVDREVWGEIEEM